MLKTGGPAGGLRQEVWNCCISRRAAKPRSSPSKTCCWPASPPTAACICRRATRRRAARNCKDRRTSLRRGRRASDRALRGRVAARACCRDAAHAAYAGFSHSAVDALDADRRQSFRAGTVSRPDARLQGCGDAAARPADGPCAEGARQAPRDGRRRHLGRYRRRGDRGVPRPATRSMSSSFIRMAASPTCSAAR